MLKPLLCFIFSGLLTVLHAQRPKDPNDTTLLNLVQEQSFLYTWNQAHPVSAMAREKAGSDTVNTGASGFSVLAVIVGAEKKWVKRDSAALRLIKMTKFLYQQATAYHGIFPRLMNGATGQLVATSRKDDGSDLVETAYLFEGLLCAREYFNQNTRAESDLRNRITALWNEAEWNFHTKDGAKEVLYRNWSPNNGFGTNVELHGWKEGLMTYILAAASPQYSIPANVYHKGWAGGPDFKNTKSYFNIKPALGGNYVGPLNWFQYPFMALNPKGLKDIYADYWQQNKNHLLIHYNYVLENPRQFIGYDSLNWGIGAGDGYRGFRNASPLADDGTITIAASVASLPYLPKESLAALHHIYNNLGDSLWGKYGLYDGYNQTQGWYSKNYIASNEAMITVMIENYRSGLIWNTFMQIPEIRAGLKKLGFSSPAIPAEKPAVKK